MSNFAGIHESMHWMKDYSQGEKTIAGFIIASIFLYLLSWRIPLMEIDAIQYANISREMLQHHQFLQIYDQGKDYLDKPPMLFWLSTLSMYIFGISAVAYRLPSFLFAILSIYSTFRLAHLYYSRRIALLSALILSSSVAMFLINHDVRTDTMLMGWVSFSIWQMGEWYKSNQWKNCILASIAIAGGLLTKGPIALCVPVFAFGSHFILKRYFKAFFRPQYLLMIIIISILLIPMCIGLYRQFDLHPEKIMYNKTGTSGLRFFFWTQSFGRITGESSWHENDHFFFLFQNMLWGLLPWILFFVTGLFQDIRYLIRQKFRLNESEEWISTGGFFITYCVLGISHYQLPHYIYVVFPLAAVIAAKSLDRFLFSEPLPHFQKPVSVFHITVFSLMLLAMLWLIWVPFPGETRWFLMIALPSIILLLFVTIKKNLPLPSLLVFGTGTFLLIHLFLDLGFYPALLEYQPAIPVSRFIKSNSINPDSVFLYKIKHERSLDFYSDHFYETTDLPNDLPGHAFVLTSLEGMDSINRNLFVEKFQCERFSVSGLTFKFILPSSRYKETKSYFLLQKK